VAALGARLQVMALVAALVPAAAVLRV